ncbi:MAG: hypothetical protein LAP38_14760 [Acidobacteriia bacterium]|nr:hypothetical protein [Terriglobia bacterium]
MSLNDSTNANGAPRTDETPQTRSHTGVLWLLFLGLALVLAGGVYQFVRAEHLSRDLAVMQANTEKRIAALNDRAVIDTESNQQRFDALKSQLEGATAAALRQARTEVTRTRSQLAKNIQQTQQELEQKHQEVASQLSDLKQDTSSKLQDTSAKLQDTSSKLQDTNVKLDQVSSDVEKTNSDLKRMVGDLGVMSGNIATNGKELAALRELGERNYFEFDLSKAKVPQKVGNIRVALKKTDPKRNRFTMEVYADDKTVEKKDRTINEPVQFYVAGSRQPCEIVVNQVKRNEVVGYLATPKVNAGRTAGGSTGF